MKLIVFFLCFVFGALACKEECPLEQPISEKPSVTILSPLNNSTIIDSVEIEVEAKDTKE